MLVDFPFIVSLSKYILILLTSTVFSLKLSLLYVAEKLFINCTFKLLVPSNGKVSSITFEQFFK